jgi:hypothetical protein
MKKNPHRDLSRRERQIMDVLYRRGRATAAFLAARADRRDLELRKPAQGRNVGIAPQPLRILPPMMPTRILFVVMTIFP